MPVALAFKPLALCLGPQRDSNATLATQNGSLVLGNQYLYGTKCCATPNAAEQCFRTRALVRACTIAAPMRHLATLHAIVFSVK